MELSSIGLIIAAVVLAGVIAIDYLVFQRNEEDQDNKKTEEKESE